MRISLDQRSLAVVLLLYYKLVIPEHKITRFTYSQVVTTREKGNNVHQIMVYNRNKNAYKPT